MRRVLLFNIIICLYLLIPFDGFSQKVGGIGMNPYYFFQGGLRLDFEKSLPDSASVLFCPQGYFMPTFAFNNDEDKYTSAMLDNNVGYGVEVFYRKYIVPYKKLGGVYASVGMGYQHFILRYDMYDYTPFVEDNLEYYKYQFVGREDVIDRVSGQVVFGFQLNTKGRAFLDVFMGTGYKKSFKDSYRPPKSYGKGMYDYYYTGFYFIPGFRYGFYI